MDYSNVAEILNRHIFEGDKTDLLNSLANNPERFIGLFRPTKPRTKILQFLLQSHEICFGDAIEELLKAILAELGYTNLTRHIQNSNAEMLSLDQYFTDGVMYYFVEQKVRDDYDSTKKRGQISNFESKLEKLSEAHRPNLVGIMYFVDPNLEKNKNYYQAELQKLSGFYNVPLYLLYGREFFDHLSHPEMWESLISWLVRWKSELPDLPEVDFDLDPASSYAEIKELSLSNWRKLVLNHRLWEEGIFQVLFRTGATLRLLLSDFQQRSQPPYQILSQTLASKLATYYR